jgi:asparagine synthase (glutamine-hydrolysing)
MCGGGKAEKQILRDALGHMLPERIAKRQKEQFSDGVGYSWIDSLKEHAETAVSDQQLANAAARFPINPPATKEGYYYRIIFAEHFPAASSAACVPGGKSVACSTETALEWDAAFKEMADPSGRAVRSVHNDAY